MLTYYLNVSILDCVESNLDIQLVYIVIYIVFLNRSANMHLNIQEGTKSFNFKLYLSYSINFVFKEKYIWEVFLKYNLIYPAQMHLVYIYVLMH